MEDFDSIITLFSWGWDDNTLLLKLKLGGIHLYCNSKAHNGMVSWKLIPNSTRQRVIKNKHTTLNWIYNTGISLLPPLTGSFPGTHYQGSFTHNSPKMIISTSLGVSSGGIGKPHTKKIRGEMKKCRKVSQLNWVVLDLVELNTVGLNWIKLNGFEISGIKLNEIQLNWIETSSIEFNWI